MGFETLQSIVSSYHDLSELRKRQILTKAESLCREWDEQSFERQYELVANLVEWNRARYHRSLDTSMYSDSDFALCDRVGTNDQQLETLLHGKEVATRVDAEKALSFLRGQLPEDELDALHQILERAEQRIDLDVSLREIETNIDDVRRRIQRFIQRNMKHGKLSTLRYAGYGIRSRLSESQIATLLGIYQACNGNTSEAARQSGISQPTVSKYWHKQGYEIREPGFVPLSDDEVTKIMAAHTIHKGSASAAAKHSPHAASTILSYWRGNGLETTSFNGLNARLNSMDIEHIIGAYAKSNGSASRARRQLGNVHSVQTILRHWSAEGLKVTEQRRLTKAEIERVQATYATSNGNATRARQQLNNAYSLVTILRWWRKKEFNIRLPHALTQEQIDEIVAAHALFNGDVRLAMSHVKRTRGCIIQHWVNAGLWHETPSQKRTKTSDKEPE